MYKPLARSFVSTGRGSIVWTWPWGVHPLDPRNPSGTRLPFLGSGFPYIIYQQKKGTLIVIWLLGYQGSSTLMPKTAEHPSFSNSTLCTGLLTTTLPPSLPSLQQESIVLHLFAFEFLLQPDDMEKLGSGLYELRTKLVLRGPTWRSMVLITYLVTVVITRLYLG